VKSSISGHDIPKGAGEAKRRERGTSILTEKFVKTKLRGKEASGRETKRNNREKRIYTRSRWKPSLNSLPQCGRPIRKGRTDSRKGAGKGPTAWREQGGAAPQTTNQGSRVQAGTGEKRVKDEE